MTTAPPTQEQDRLKAHFNNHPPAHHNARWDALWSAGDFIPWDRGFTNPALIDALNERHDLLPAPKSASGRRARVLVPGCGKGYDVALFAAHGYDAFGLEVSEHAVTVAEEYLGAPGEGPLEGEYRVGEAGRGVMKCLLGDFFEEGWQADAGGLGEGFDVIYDNTFLCALHPSFRSQWAERVVQLLAPGGVLLCLEFPTHKPPKSGGPPYALPSIVHEELLKRPGEDIRYDQSEKVLSTSRAESEKALVKVAHWKPKRTHEVGIIKGEVTDRVSVWRHK